MPPGIPPYLFSDVQGGVEERIGRWNGKRFLQSLQIQKDFPQSVVADGPADGIVELVSQQTFPRRFQ